MTPRTCYTEETGEDVTEGDNDVNCLRVSSWNVNSINTSLPELVNYIDADKPDIVMIQETKTRNFKFSNRPCSVNSLAAQPKNNRKGGYLSGGIATIGSIQDGYANPDQDGEQGDVLQWAIK